MSRLGKTPRGGWWSIWLYNEGWARDPKEYDCTMLFDDPIAAYNWAFCKFGPECSNAGKSKWETRRVIMYPSLRRDR